MFCKRETCTVLLVILLSLCLPWFVMKNKPWTQQEIAIQKDREAWRFLDLVETPTWVNLTQELTANYTDLYDYWFHISHPYHRHHRFLASSGGSASFPKLPSSGQVYGGGIVGLMGLISQKVYVGGCHVLGVIRKALMLFEEVWNFQNFCDMTPQERCELLGQVAGHSLSEVEDIEMVLEMMPSLTVEVNYETEGEEDIEEGDIVTIQAWLTLKRAYGFVGALPHCPCFPFHKCLVVMGDSNIHTGKKITVIPHTAQGHGSLRAAIDVVELIQCIIQAVPLSARDCTLSAEGIAPFLQLPQFSESLAKRIAHKVGNFQNFCDMTLQERCVLLGQVAGLSSSEVEDIEMVLEMMPSLTVGVNCETEGEEDIEEGDVVTIQAWLTMKRANGFVGALPHCP